MKEFWVTNNTPFEGYNKLPCHLESRPKELDSDELFITTVLISPPQRIECIAHITNAFIHHNNLLINTEISLRC